MKGPPQRTFRRTLFVFFSVITCLFLLIAVTQRSIDVREDHLKEEYLFIPEVPLLKHFTFGFDNFIGDIYWLMCIQYAAEKEYSVNGLNWLYGSLDLITTLDKKFETAYLFGGIILSTDRAFVGKGNFLLEKGMKNLPDKWRFPFYIGFNYFFYLQKFDLAARYILNASRLPGSPPYLPFLASRLLAEANQPDTALAFLENMYNQTADPVLREKILDRIKYVIVEKDVIYLEKGVRRFYDLYGQYPETLQALVDKGIADEVPEEPFGGYYYVDRKTGRVSSSKVDRRYKLFRPTGNMERGPR